MKQNGPKVVIAMSGGVDSSVAAARLVEQGFQVVGLMLRLWSEAQSETYNRCCPPEALALAQRVAAILDIPFHVLDAQEAFRQAVVEEFINGYASGLTPNPCLLCNRDIRWGFLLDRALALGAEYMATGHYVRLQQDPLGCFQILRGVDPDKDQSYVLHVLNQEQLAHSLFPLGEFSKPQVRQMARQYALPVAERPDSQDLCFIDQGDYRAFLERHAPRTKAPGSIMTPDGRVLGQHQGLAFYTIGQRKGLGISAPRALYVLQKDIQRNALIVGPAEALGQQELTAGPIHWVVGEPPAASFRAQVKIRYKANYAWGTVTVLENERVHLRFDEPQRDITPGQAAVFYDTQICLGGGIIL